MKWIPREELKSKQFKKRKITKSKELQRNTRKNIVISNNIIRILLIQIWISLNNWKMIFKLRELRMLICKDKKWTNKKPTTRLSNHWHKLMLKSLDLRRRKYNMMLSWDKWRKFNKAFTILIVNLKRLNGNMKSDFSNTNILKKKRKNSLMNSID